MLDTISNAKMVDGQRVEPDWRIRARELSAQGLTDRKIAERLGRNFYTIRNFIASDIGNIRLSNDITETCLTDKHQPRRIRDILKYPAVLPAAQRFARGEITRAELMQAISA